VLASSRASVLPTKPPTPVIKTFIGTWSIDGDHGAKRVCHDATISRVICERSFVIAHFG
jgi:hypothetical protein